jgi:hypothetical protein
MTPRVRPLDWQPHNCGFRADDGFGGYYSVCEEQWTHTSTDHWVLCEGGDNSAKLGAQMDFASRTWANIC